MLLWLASWDDSDHSFTQCLSRFPAGRKYSFPPCIVSVLLAPSTGPNAPSQVPLVLLEDVSNVYGDVEVDRSKHIHKKRKLAEGREKPMVISSDLITSRVDVYVC